MRNLVKQEAGFTLLELLVVVAIIGVLAAIIVPQVSDSSDEAERAAAEASLSNLQTALERYYMDEDAGDGSYPAESDLEEDLGIASADNITYYNGEDDTDLSGDHPDGDDTDYEDPDYLAVYDVEFNG
ncbi:MAG: type II secretion system protein, partial [Halanaerobiales bacterium]